jgi:hypothetical protein
LADQAGVEEWAEVAHLVELFRLGPDLKDEDGEGGAKDATLQPLARVLDPLVLDDAVRLDLGDHNAPRGVVAVEDALGVDLNNGPNLSELC